MKTDVSVQTDSKLQTDVYDVSTHVIEDADHPARGWAVQVDLRGDFTLIESFGHDSRMEAAATGVALLGDLHRGLERVHRRPELAHLRPKHSGPNRDIGSVLRAASPDQIRHLIKLGQGPEKPTEDTRSPAVRARNAVSNFIHYAVAAGLVTKDDVDGLAEHFREALDTTLARKAAGSTK